MKKLDKRTKKARERMADFMKGIYRQNVLNRDGNQCRKCHTTIQLTVHHIMPQREYPQLACEEDNMITLCRKCHDDLEIKLAKAKSEVKAWKETAGILADESLMASIKLSLKQISQGKGIVLNLPAVTVQETKIEVKP